MTFSARDIEMAASAIGNQVAAGIPLGDAVWRMQRLQRRHGAVWHDIAQRVRNGHPLSQALNGLWPESLVAAVRAGEESGRLPEVFERISHTLALQARVRAVMRGLLYPFGIALSGLVIFFGFLVFVIPQLGQALGPDKSSLVFWLSDQAVYVYKHHLFVVLAVVAGAAAAAYVWLSDAERRAALIDVALAVPLLGAPLRDLHFGLWANYLAVLAGSGLPVQASLRASAAVLPRSLRAGVQKMADELSVRSIADAADPEKQSADDPRQQWPYYISAAFMVSNETGRVDKEMLRVASPLTAEGFARVAAVMKTVNVAALGLAGLLLVSPLAAYYTELGRMLQRAMAGG
jgi:type II secretory pathway component PulF